MGGEQQGKGAPPTHTHPRTVLWAACPLWKRFGSDDGIALQELVELAAVGKARASHTNVFLETQVAHLRHKGTTGSESA